MLKSSASLFDIVTTAFAEAEEDGLDRRAAVSYAAAAVMQADSSVNFSTARRIVDCLLPAAAA